MPIGYKFQNHSFFHSGASNSKKESDNLVKVMGKDCPIETFPFYGRRTDQPHATAD